MGFFKKLKEKVTSPKATITLKLNKNTYALGEKLEGILSVTSEEEIDVTEIRAELRCNERKKTMKYTTEIVTLPDGRQTTKPVWKEDWETATIYSENPQSSGSIHLSTGYKGDLPFSTSIPTGGQATYSSMDRVVEWNIKGVIGVKGRPDVTGSNINLLVNAAPTMSTVITEKIVEREVVMMPCQYCGTIFSQTATTCPNCGAKRKA